MPDVESTTDNSLSTITCAFLQLPFRVQWEIASKLDVLDFSDRNYTDEQVYNIWASRIRDRHLYDEFQALVLQKKDTNANEDTDE